MSWPQIMQYLTIKDTNKLAGSIMNYTTDRRKNRSMKKYGNLWLTYKRLTDQILLDQNGERREIIREITRLVTVTQLDNGETEYCGKKYLLQLGNDEK